MLEHWQTLIRSEGLEVTFVHFNMNKFTKRRRRKRGKRRRRMNEKEGRGGEVE